MHTYHNCYLIVKEPFSISCDKTTCCLTWDLLYTKGPKNGQKRNVKKIVSVAIALSLLYIT